MGFILSWFAVHRAILHSWGDISVLLVLSQCPWRLSSIPSSKSGLLLCLIGNTGLLCMQCRGIEPHHPARGMSHGIYWVAAGTWGILSSYSRDGHSKLHFVQRSQDTCLVMTDIWGERTWRLGLGPAQWPEPSSKSQLPCVSGRDNTLPPRR